MIARNVLVSGRDATEVAAELVARRRGEDLKLVVFADRRVDPHVAVGVGGRIETLLAFSCLARHSEAGARDMVAALADVYAAYPTTGFQSGGEQTGMLLVNHTLTALAIGAPR